MATLQKRRGPREGRREMKWGKKCAVYTHQLLIRIAIIMYCKDTPQKIKIEKLEKKRL